jgi:hypothetical protein
MSSTFRAAPVTAPIDESLVRTLSGIAILIFGGVAAIIAWQAPSGGLPGLWVTLALQLVPGAVIGLYFHLRGVALALATIFGSAAALVLISLPMAWFGWWHVRPVATVLLLATSSFGAVITSGDVGRIDRQAAPEIARRIRLWTFGPGGLATIGFALALAAAKDGLPQQWGAIVAGGPVCWLGLLFIVVSVAWAFGGGGGGPGWAVVLLSCVVQSVQAMTYRLPTVQVTARHVGIAESIIRYGKVFPENDIYQAWSGLFASAAFVKVASGWNDMLLYAAVWGAVAAAVMALAVRAVAGQFHGEKRAWSAALVFGLASSLNTTFFAPQMFGFIGAFIIIVLMLRMGDPRYGRYVISDGVVVIATAVAVTHQLSPYLAFLAVAALTFTRMITRWTAGLLLIVPAVLFAYLNLDVLGPYVSKGDLGKFLENLRPPTHSTSAALEPSLINRVTFDVPAAALAAIGILALVVVWRHRKSKQILALAVAAASPIALFAGSNYGNEGIFRVALFALPWLAILVVYLLPEPGRRFWTLSLHPVRILAVMFLSMVQVIGCTGMDYSRVIRSDDVAAVTWIENTVPEGSYVFTLGTNLSEPLFVTGRLLTYTSRETLLLNTPSAYPTTTGTAYDPKADLAMLTDAWASQSGGKKVYVLATDSMRVFDERYGQQLASDQMRLEAELRSGTVSWQVVYYEPGARVYEFLGVAP